MIGWLRSFLARRGKRHNVFLIALVFAFLVDHFCYDVVIDALEKEGGPVGSWQRVLISASSYIVAGVVTEWLCRERI